MLVVVYDKRFNGWLEVHERLKKAYTPLFRQIVYTGFMLQVRWCSLLSKRCTKDDASCHLRHVGKPHLVHGKPCTWCCGLAKCQEGNKPFMSTM